MIEDMRWIERTILVYVAPPGPPVFGPAGNAIKAQKTVKVLQKKVGGEWEDVETVGPEEAEEGK